MSRGAGHWIEGGGRSRGDSVSTRSRPASRPRTKACYIVQHQYWQETMKKAVAAEDER